MMRVFPGASALYGYEVGVWVGSAGYRLRITSVNFDLFYKTASFDFWAMHNLRIHST